MTTKLLPDLTICGLDELGDHSTRAVTHVLSILDPNWPEPEAFWTYDPHHRVEMHFNDAIEPARASSFRKRAMSRRFWPSGTRSSVISRFGAKRIF